MPKNGKRRTRFDRRRIIQAGGLAGAGVLAGCLGDDTADDDVDDADDADPADDTDDTDPADDTDDVDDADDAPAIERHDVRAYYTRTRGPLPADIQYHPRGDPTPAWYDNRHQYDLMSRSWADLEVYGELLADWNYEPGILELNFRDDVFWWSGEQLDAADYMANMTIDDWHWGGDDLDANPNIITYDQIDDQTVRLSLADTWREAWATQQTVINTSVNGAATFLDPWVEEFEDTGGDMDAVGEVRDDLEEYDAVTDEDLVHQFHIPFEFRLDGSIGEVGEHWWILELIPEKNGTLRYRADEINFTEWYIGAEEEGIYNTERFMAEEQPRVGDLDILEEDLPFDTHTVMFERDFDQWGWTMNAEEHPTDNPWFRRAWTFATDNEAWGQPDMIPQEFGAHPFLTDDRLEHWVSDDVIDQMTDYGTNAEWDRAEEEMEIGGFERNADGMYLNQETGEPIDLTIGTTGEWMGYVEDLGSDWWEDINDWGIQAESVLETGDDPYRIDATYVGGNVPEFVFDSIFGEAGLSWAAPNPNFDESVMAPPLGEADAPEEDWVEYDTRTMTDRLGVTIDDEPYQDLVNQLSWVVNQLVPRTPVVANQVTNVCNDNRWNITPIEDAHPDKYLFILDDRMWFNGLLSYVPEEDR